MTKRSSHFYEYDKMDSRNKMRVHNWLESYELTRAKESFRILLALKSVEEVAEYMGIKVSTANTHLRNVRVQFAMVIRNEEGD